MTRQPSDATARFYFDAPVDTVDTGTARLPCRRYGERPGRCCSCTASRSRASRGGRCCPSSRRATRATCPIFPAWASRSGRTPPTSASPGQGRTLKALVDRLGLARYSVLAQDTGGTFARYLALEDLARVDKLVLDQHRDAAPSPAVDPALPVPDAAAGHAHGLRAPAALSCSSCAPAWGSAAASPTSTSSTATSTSTSSSRCCRSPRRMDGMRRYLRGAQWAPVDALATEHARLTMPVQLIWGADDPTFPVALARRWWRSSRTRRSSEIPGARLLVHEEKPAEVARAVARLPRMSGPTSARCA